MPTGSWRGYALCFNWAVGKDRLPGLSWSSGIQAPTKEKARERWLSDQEIIRFWQACEQIDYPFGPLFRFLLLTGQRRTEASQMEWAELDLDTKLWTIPASKAKSGRTHEVQLSSQAIEILRFLPPAQPLCLRR